MFSSRYSSYRLFLGLIWLFSLLNYASAFDIPYCSSINTADTAKNSSIYQSNGLCFDFCKANFAFAVVQYDGCWCSNYVPETKTNSASCNTVCPGYSELCGGNGLFGYIQLDNPPLGTKGLPKSTSSKTQVSTVISSTASMTTTVIPPPPIITSFSSKASSSSITSRQSTSPVESTTTSSPLRSSNSWVATPIVSLETITGLVRTVTVIPTGPPDLQNLNDVTGNENRGSRGLGTGGAVGLTIGLVVVIALISAIIFFCIKRRKQQKQEEQGEDYSSRPDSFTALGGPVPSRSMSENSRYVLGTDGRQVVETWEPEPREEIRKSRLMPVDPRLDPFSPVYQRGENKSRESVNTIRDDHDYSRRVHDRPVLRAMNPDE